MLVFRLAARNLFRQARRNVLSMVSIVLGVFIIIAGTGFARGFNENAIRADLRETMNAAGNCRLEVIMKDVHTLRNQPERLPRWVAMAREECGAG